MAYLKVYAWENEKWPEFQTVKLERDRQHALIKKLARHFKVDPPQLRYSHQRGANAAQSASGVAGKYHHSTLTSWAVIKLGKVTTLGTLVHEFAHHLNWRRWQVDGHGRTFKRELKRTYTWTKRYLPAPNSSTGK